MKKVVGLIKGRHEMCQFLIGNVRLWKQQECKRLEDELNQAFKEGVNSS